MHSPSPFPGLIGLPSRWPDTSGHSFELSWNTASHSLFQKNGTESLLVDGETHTLAARIQGALGRRARLGFELPWISHSGGFMDGAIDAWHDLFGLPNGIRSTTPRNELRIIYRKDGREIYRRERPASGLGDIRLDLSVDLLQYNHATIGLVAGIKLPTGDEKKLTGSGATDYTAGVRFAAPPEGDGRFSWGLDVGVVWPGAVRIAGLEESAQVYYYDFALTWHAFRSVALLAQLSGYSDPYRSALKALGRPGAQLGLGLNWRLSRRYSIRFGFFEDIRTETSPDYGTELALGVRY